MKPVRVTTSVPAARENVYDYLDAIANHEPFTNHMLHDFQYSGPPRGVGAKAQVKATVAGRTDTIDIEVISAHRPTTIVEQNVGAGGRRVATGTYDLQALPDGGTQISFEYAWQQAPMSERLAAPLVRTVMRRANQRSLQRLAEHLAAQPAPAGSALTDPRGG
jgi:carbon monoxide dehydrogenase subunit G